MAATVNTRRGTRQAMGVSFDLQGAVQVQRDLGLLADRLPWLQERAIRTLRRRLPVEARRDIQAEYNIGAARVRDHLVARLIEGGTSARIAGVRLTGQWKRGIGLVNFSARQTRKGVSYSVYRGKRDLAEGAFVARLMGRPDGFIGPLKGNVHAVERMPSGPLRERAYIQKGRNGKYQRGTRTDRPLRVLYRSTIAQMLAKGRRPERLLDFSRNLLQQDVERQLRSYMRNPRAEAPTT